MLRDNPRVHDTRQTENLRENWILRQRNRECNNSPFVISRWFSWGKTGNKKAVWRVQTALKQKNGGAFLSKSEPFSVCVSRGLPALLRRHMQETEKNHPSPNRILHILRGHKNSNRSYIW